MPQTNQLAASDGTAGERTGLLLTVSGEVYRVLSGRAEASARLLHCQSCRDERRLCGPAQAGSPKDCSWPLAVCHLLTFGDLSRHQPAAQIALIPPARSGPSWHDSARESRPQRTLPLRQREKIQALPRRRGCRAGTCGRSRRRVLRSRVPRWNCVPDVSCPLPLPPNPCLTVRYPTSTATTIRAVMPCKDTR